ncbi:hypothetical protein PGT21_033821 [Puccinia graminis f. sp. tritici]|uniref:Uncharacterized protein n=1 Tax=Puccinia graminis f. sp. tritici TaxID=56615 RepID=A0A5B0Q7T6_PUCGR|nr:hypothetical protein PGT21_033821 [Puccinia graminis f. sp. tritici]
MSPAPNHLAACVTRPNARSCPRTQHDPFGTLAQPSSLHGVPAIHPSASDSNE